MVLQFTTNLRMIGVHSTLKQELLGTTVPLNSKMRLRQKTATSALSKQQPQPATSVLMQPTTSTTTTSQEQSPRIKSRHNKSHIQLLLESEHKDELPIIPNPAK